MQNIHWKQITTDRLESACWRWTILANEDGSFSLRDGTLEEWVDTAFKNLDDAKQHAERVEEREFEGVY